MTDQPHVTGVDLPEALINDDNHAQPIQLPKGLSELPISSSPQYTLYRLLRHLQPRSVLEIGSQIGASAVAMALAFRDNGEEVDVTCIDPFYPSGDNDGLSTLSEWYQNVYGSGFKEGIDLLVTTSAEIMPFLNKEFDFVFVDGSHEYRDVKQDCRMALGLLSVGGYFMAHDYMTYEGVRRALEETVAEFELPFAVNRIQRNFRGDLCGWLIARKLREVEIDMFEIQDRDRSTRRREALVRQATGPLRAGARGLKQLKRAIRGRKR